MLVLRSRFEYQVSPGCWTSSLPSEYTPIAVCDHFHPVGKGYRIRLDNPSVRVARLGPTVVQAQVTIPVLREPLADHSVGDFVEV